MANVNLNTADLQTLVALIERFGDVGTDSKRANLLDEAGLRSFQGRIAPGTSHDWSTELVRVLETHGTLDVTGEPALVAVLRVLRDHRVQGQETERAFVDRLLHPYPDFPAVLTPEQKENVVALRLRLLKCRLDDRMLPADVLQRAYRAALPNRMPPSTGAKPVGLHAIVADLADYPPAPHDGAESHPLLTFALRLAKSVADTRPAEAAHLSDWAYEAMPHWAPHATRPSLNHAASLHRTQAQPDESRLIVRVMPLDGDPAVFKKPRTDWRVQFDAFIGPQGTPPQRCRDATDASAVTVGDLQGEIEQLIDRLSETHARPDWIEFFLPAALMSLQTDQWCCRLPFDDEGRLGSEHKVVVRSWDRAFIPTHLNWIRRDWEARWALLEQNESADFEAGHVLWVEPNPEPVAGSRTLRLDLKASPATTCVAFAFDPVDPDAALDHARAIISAGIPVALWPRRSDTTGTAVARSEIASLLRNADTPPDGAGSGGHLCDAVKHARVKGAGCAGNHLAQHLTLMWDDPNDLGVLAPLQAPSEGGK